MSRKEVVSDWFRTPPREQGLREFPRRSQFNGRTGDEEEVKASIVHPKESFLKGGFLTHELPTFFNYSVHKLAIPLFHPERK